MPEHLHELAVRQLEMGGIPCGEAMLERDVGRDAIQVGYVQYYTPQLLMSDAYPHILDVEGQRAQRAWIDGLRRARRDLEGKQP